ncbi:MAG: DinB family protein [Reichenbachiella sp.]|uniref:DinB family protein n=1 Tax=Reichenbachiella sp. TaxID=2184521 RepID=UPI0032665962
MKRNVIWMGLFLLLTTACGTTQNKTNAESPQENTPITKEQVLAAWERMTNMVINSTEKMPAEFFSYSPIEPLASYGALVNHTAGANYLFAATVKLERPEQNEIDTDDKEAVVGNLSASFKFIKNGIQQLTNQDLNEEIEWFGSNMSRLNAILTMTDHLQREYGKNITYLRLKGIEPERSAGW